jgi:hypothetical protein
MTLPEFLDWNPGDPSGRTWQLIDGEPIAMAPETETHAAIQGELGALLRNPLREQRSPCRLLTEPGNIPRVRANRNFRVPDLRVTYLAFHSTRTEAELPRRNLDSTWPAEPEIVTANVILTVASIGYRTPLTALYRATALAA